MSSIAKSGAFRVVGLQSSALELSLKQGQSARIIPGAASLLVADIPDLKLIENQVTGPVTAIFGLRRQAAILSQTENWAVRNQYLVATAAQDFALAAPGGVYRVDVPEASSLVVNPQYLVGYTGLSPTSIFLETSLDVARGWFEWFRDGLVQVYQGAKLVTTGLYGYIARSVRWTAKKLPQNRSVKAIAPPVKENVDKTLQDGVKQGITETSSIKEISSINETSSIVKANVAQPKALNTTNTLDSGSKEPNPIAESAKLPAQLPHYWQTAKTVSSRAWDELQDKSFEYTHHEKLEFRGPCSVLLRGQI